MKINGKRQINGTFGKVYINGIEFADIEEFNADVDIDRKDTNWAGSLGTDSKIISTKGSGSFKIKKVYSREVAMILPIIKTGKDVRSIITTELKDPDAYGAERVSIEDAWFNNLNIANFKVADLVNKEIKFGFNPDNVEFLDIIEK